jgi:hypothetical protein
MTTNIKGTLKKKRAAATAKAAARASKVIPSAETKV